VENLVIVSTKDAVLVMNRERSQDVKKAVEFLKQKWWCICIEKAPPGFTVMRLTLKRGVWTTTSQRPQGR
jgi:hypothetical protein